MENGENRDGIVLIYDSPHCRKTGTLSSSRRGFLVCCPFISNNNNNNTSFRMTGTATLWMGDLEPYMEEYFITRAFNHFGEHVVNVKLIRNKHTGVPAGYCFVEFPNPEAAHRTMLRLNGKIVPNSVPNKRFKLNHASYGKDHGSSYSVSGLRKRPGMSEWGRNEIPVIRPEYSLFVGDLSDDVDDYILYVAFSKRYRSCRAAKVVLDSTGRSKGYGFVRFSDENEQQRALYEMQHCDGIGRKPIRVSLATPKRPLPDVPGTQTAQQYSQYYQQYQQYQNYYENWSAYSSYYNQYGYSYAGGYTMDNMEGYYDDGTEEEMEMLEDPVLEIDVTKANSDFMEQSEEIFESLEASRWQAVDSVSTTLAAAAAAMI